MWGVGGNHKQQKTSDLTWTRKGCYRHFLPTIHQEKERGRLLMYAIFT